MKIEHIRHLPPVSPQDNKPTWYKLIEKFDNLLQLIDPSPKSLCSYIQEQFTKDNIRLNYKCGDLEVFVNGKPSRVTIPVNLQKDFITSNETNRQVIAMELANNIKDSLAIDL